MADADPDFSGTVTEAEAGTVTTAASKRRWGKLALMLVVPLLLLIGGVTYWQSLQGQVETDNEIGRAHV